MTVLVTSEGKPVAVILAIAVLIVATAIPIVAFKLSPTPINPHNSGEAKDPRLL